MHSRWLKRVFAPSNISTQSGQGHGPAEHSGTTTTQSCWVQAFSPSMQDLLVFEITKAPQHSKSMRRTLTKMQIQQGRVRNYEGMIRKKPGITNWVFAYQGIKDWRNGQSCETSCAYVIDCARAQVLCFFHNTIHFITTLLFKLHFVLVWMLSSCKQNHANCS